MDFRELATRDTYDLRSRVLRPGRGPEAARFPLDASSRHFGMVEAGRVVGVVSVHAEDSPLFMAEGGWRIRGMAVDPGAQGRGVGSRLLVGLLAWARAERIPFFWCNARVVAFDFYRRHGFTFESELFEIEDVGPHRVMRVVL